MAFLLVQAQESTQGRNKGEIVVAKDVAEFGTAEALPKYIRLEIEDVTAAEVANFLDHWKTSLEYSIVAQNAAGWRVKIEVDRKVIARTGVAAEIKQHIKEWLLDSTQHPDWSATQVSAFANEITLDIPKDQAADLAEIRRQVNDFFIDTAEEMSGYQRYRFSNQDVDFGSARGLVIEAAAKVANGGVLPGDTIHHSMSKQAALSRIIDRSAD